MLTINTIVHNGVPQDFLMLTFEYRQKSRQSVVLESGDAAALVLPRGTLLRDGNLLQADDGRIIQVKSAPEATAIAVSDDSLLLMRACFHLGNRHVPLQIGQNFVRFQQDHVLEQMVASFGLDVRHEEAPFEPETGAYHSHAH